MSHSDSETRDLSEPAAAIHASGRQLVIACTGGGSGAIAALLQTPGASRSVLEAIVPYSEAALAKFLGAQPEQACSERTARALAMAAWQRARALEPHVAAERLLGVGCTASLATDRPKRGAHRVHAAVQSATATVVHSLTLAKGARTRQGEEQVAAAMILDALLHEVGAGSWVRSEAEPPVRAPEGSLRSNPAALLPEERVETKRVVAEGQIAELLLGRVAAVLREPLGGWRALAGGDPALEEAVLFPGAFNPLHDGHRLMAAVASERLGRRVVFELSIANVDKPPLDFAELAARAEQFADAPLLLTAAPTFVEKARLAPGCTFVVGADTIERIGQARYYGGAAQRDAAIAELAALGCKFLVFGRTVGETFKTLPEIDLLPQLALVCQGVSAAEFRDDVSSTELRRSSP